MQVELTARQVKFSVVKAGAEEGWAAIDDIQVQPSHGRQTIAAFFLFSAEFIFFIFVIFWAIGIKI